MFDQCADLPEWPEDLVFDLTRAAVDEGAPGHVAPDDVLPPGLEQLPIEITALVIGRIDPAVLSDAQRVRYVAASERVNAAGAARTLAGVHAVAGSYAALDLEELSDAHAGAVFELRSALRWTRRAAESELDLSHDLIERIPAAYRALRDGRIDRRRAAVFARHTAHLAVAHARQVAGPRSTMPTDGRPAS